VIEPGELYWDPGLESLYMIGWCRLRRDIRVFALQRFVAATLTDEPFTPRAGARSKAALRGAFRVWRDENIQKVRIRYAAKVSPEIRERVWGPGQRIDEEDPTPPTGGGGVALTLEVAGLAEIERWVLGYGGAAEVLEPATLRQAVTEKSGAAAARYGHLPPANAAVPTHVGVNRRDSRQSLPREFCGPHPRARRVERESGQLRETPPA
jgi:predicted DNA-binding transcriptional regulator YafY